MWYGSSIEVHRIRSSNQIAGSAGLCDKTLLYPRDVLSDAMRMKADDLFTTAVRFLPSFLPSRRVRLQRR